MSRMDWQPIIKKVERRLGGWYAMLLSRHRQLVLLRSVLATIPTFFYVYSNFPLELERGKGAS